MNLLPQRSSTTAQTDPNAKPAYEARVDVHPSLRVVEADKGETVQVISNPDIDAGMEACFSVARNALRSTEYDTPAGKRRSVNSPTLRHASLPVDVCFRITWRLADGREHTASEERQIRAGKPGEIGVDVAGHFLLARQGDHALRVILRPDPESAYRDPETKAIWGGTLDFETTVTIEKAD